MAAAVGISFMGADVRPGAAKRKSATFRRYMWFLWTKGGAPIVGLKDLFTISSSW